MNVQEMIVGILVLVSLLWLIKRIKHYFRQISKDELPCAGCGCAGCPSSGNCISEKK